MKALGIVRKIDELGRIVIPKEVRKAHGWGTGQPMEMFVEGERVIMQPYGREREKEELITKLKAATSTKEYIEALDEAVSYLEND